MTINKFLLSSLVLLSLLACNDNAKDSFMVHTQDVAVIDITRNKVLLNAVEVPGAYEEILKIEDLLIPILDKPLRAARTKGVKKIHTHIDSTESFKFLHRTIPTVGFSGIVNHEIVIGENFNLVFDFTSTTHFMENRSAKYPPCLKDPHAIRSGSIGKSETDLLLDIVCSDKTGDDEKYRAQQRLDYLSKAKALEFRNLSAEYIPDCRDQNIHGACWKFESNDTVQPLFLTEENAKALLKIDYETNKKSSRKDKSNLTLRAPENTPINSILSMLKTAYEIGFQIEFAVAEEGI